MTVSKATPKLKLRTLVIVLTIGILMVIIGAIVIPVAFQALMDAILDQTMEINPKSAIYPEWKDPTIPIYTRFYFFDLQNPKEVLQGAKPSVTQIGPYSYKMALPRVNITFNPNDTVTSYQPYSYVFDRSQSIGDENDTFMTTNMPFWSTVYFVRDMGSLIQGILAVFLKQKKEEPFIRLSVKQLIWGYDEPIFKWVHKYLPNYPLPPGFETQFGFLLGRNNTALGQYTAFTGVKDKARVNKIDRFDGMDKLTYWKSDYANQINGTDGMMYHMGIKEDELLYLFHPDLCSCPRCIELRLSNHQPITRQFHMISHLGSEYISMPYTYVKDDTLEDIPLKLFGVAPWAYENGSTYPPNQGFNITHDYVPDGIMRIDPCRYKTPIALSNPHFFDGDPDLWKGVNGLHPDGDKHRNSFSIEPILGMPFKLRMRLQINQYMEQVSGIGQTENVKTMYMPCFWFEEDVTANDEVIGYYNNGIKLTGIIALVLQYLSIAIGASLIIGFTLVGLCKFMVKPKKSIMAESDATNYSSTQACENAVQVGEPERNIQI